MTSDHRNIIYFFKKYTVFLETGYLVGSGGNILSLDVSGGQLTSFSPISSPTTNDLHAIHVFRDNSFIVAGASGTIYYDNLALSGWINCSPSTNAHYTNFTFNDIYFRDDINGYVVGDSATNLGGVIMKCQVLGGAGQIQSLSPTTYSGASNPLGFVEEPVEDGSTAKNIVSNTNQINYNTIAFTGPYDGFIGGSYSVTPPSNTQNYPYARLLNDRGGEFSNLFWYDRIGRLMVVQNTKQHDYLKQAYSYNIYDQFNRVTESGQKIENLDTANTFNKIFGDTLFGFYDATVVNQSKCMKWIKDSSGPRTEVTHFYYDTQNLLPQNILVQQNLRNRTASITYSDTLRKDSTQYTNASFFSYDIIGDMPTLIQDDSIPNISGQRYKRIDYKYDISANKLLEVDYQPDKLDQYHHKYFYDADYRITGVQTSRDSVLWDNDAHYFYYPHGPLARTEIGDQQVQGIDNSYVLQGGIKGVNSDQADGVHDMGHDGLQQEGNLNRYFARDAIGYSLKYFDKSSLFPGDYDAISSSAWGNITNRFEAYTYGSDLTNARRDLFNSNISGAVTTITEPQKYSKASSGQQPIILPQGTAYNYDQLNRLVDMKAYQNLNTSTNTWETGSTYVGLYHNTLTYDENGNILSQQRNDSVGGVMSILNYHYNNNNGTGPTLQNRLYLVNNAAPTTNPLDIKDEGVFNSAVATINQKNNYRYTAMGELGKDTIGGIDTIIWKTNGKIWKVRKYNGDSIIFTYNPSNYRIRKEYKPFSGSPVYTYYVRDLHGSLLAIYTEKTVSSSIEYILDEREIYGNSKIGTDRTSMELISPIPITTVDTFSRYDGLKEYELKNYLNDVLAVVTDRKIPRPNSVGDSVRYYEPDVVNSKDYYPFGMVEPGRNFETKKYRYAFNDKEKDDELYGADDSYDYGERMYDPRLGRFLTTDPISVAYPSLSPYSYCANNPILFIDKEGDYIRIAYQDANGITQYYFYGTGQTLPSNDFVISTVKALDMLKLDDVADPKLAKAGISVAARLADLSRMDASSRVTIQYGQAVNGEEGCDESAITYTPNANGDKVTANSTITWDPSQGVKEYVSFKSGYQADFFELPAFIILGHELVGHTWSAFFNSSWFWSNQTPDGSVFDDPEEEWNIEVVEHNMATFFCLKMGIRDDHRGEFYYTQGAFSTDKTVSEGVGPPEGYLWQISPVDASGGLFGPFKNSGINIPNIPGSNGGSMGKNATDQGGNNDSGNNSGASNGNGGSPGEQTAGSNDEDNPSDTDAAQTA